jgi:hypothetical protein
VDVDGVDRGGRREERKWESKEQGGELGLARRRRRGGEEKTNQAVTMNLKNDCDDCKMLKCEEENGNLERHVFLHTSLVQRYSLGTLHSSSTRR